MKPRLSVIICTHNPREDFIQRTLQGLREQTLALQEWELILIDNASAKPLNSRLDVEWHPNARIVLESQLGLTRARIKGFQEAVSDLVLLVDDDNILSKDFLSQTLQIACKYPELGAWGSSISGEFENPPPKWIIQELLYLAVRPISNAQISHTQRPGFPTPAGAGMTVRRVVFESYLTLLKNDDLRLDLDRKGRSLVSSGDSDLAMCAWDANLGLANFPELKLVHLIPKNRMTVAYMKRLHESMTYSDRMMKYVRKQSVEPLKSPWSRKAKVYLREFLNGRFPQICFYHSQQKGLRRARVEIQALAEPPCAKIQ